MRKREAGREQKGGTKREMNTIGKINHEGVHISQSSFLG